MTDEQVDRMERILQEANRDFARKVDELIQEIKGQSGGSAAQAVQEILTAVQEIRDAQLGMR